MTIINTSSAAQTNSNYAGLDFVEKYENPIEYSHLSFNEMDATNTEMHHRCGGWRRGFKMDGYGQDNHILIMNILATLPDEL